MVRSNDLRRVNRGKNIGLSISWIALLLSMIWMVFTRAPVVSAGNILLFWHLD